MTQVKNESFLPRGFYRHRKGINNMWDKAHLSNGVIADYNSDIADSTKDAKSKADLLLEEIALQGLLMKGIR